MVFRFGYIDNVGSTENLLKIHTENENEKTKKTHRWAHKNTYIQPTSG